MRINEIKPDLREDVYIYLDDLRESGVTNMYGARSYILDEFAGTVDDDMSKQLLRDWMESFSERHGYDDL